MASSSGTGKVLLGELPVLPAGYGQGRETPRREVPTGLRRRQATVYDAVAGKPSPQWVDSAFLPQF